MVRRSKLGYICIDQTRFWRDVLWRIPVSKSDGLTVVPTPSALETWITDYLDEKRAAGRSRKTLAVYTDVLRRCSSPTASGPVSRSPAELTSRHLNALSTGLARRHRDPLGPAAQQVLGGQLRPHHQRLPGVARQAGRGRGRPVQKPSDCPGEWSRP